MLFTASPESVTSPIRHRPDCGILFAGGLPQCKTTSHRQSLGGMFERRSHRDGCCRPECVKDEECGVAQMCVEGFCETQPRSACLFDDPPETETVTLSITVPISTLTTDGPFEDATVKACRKFDTGCDAPVAEAVSAGTGLPFTLPADFSGFLEVTEEGYYPMLSYVPTPLQDDEVLTPMTLLTNNTVLGLGFMNFPAGNTTITFIPAGEDDVKEDFTTETVNVRAGYVTNVRLAPGRVAP